MVANLNGTRCRDGVKVLWCHSHLVRLVFRIPSLHALVELDGNDTTTLSHHPYILCLFAATYTNMLCGFVSCVERVVEGSVVGSAGSGC